MLNMYNMSLIQQQECIIESSECIGRNIVARKTKWIVS